MERFKKRIIEEQERQIADMALSPRDAIGPLLSPKQLMEEEEKKINSEILGRRNQVI